MVEEMDMEEGEDGKFEKALISKSRSVCYDFFVVKTVIFATT
jgi:hypothetical protein